MRDYGSRVPGDVVASEADERPAWALDILRKGRDAGISPSSTLRLASRLSNEEA